MKFLLALPLAAVLLTGCVVVPLGPHHAYVDRGPAVVVPAPAVVRPYYWHHRPHRYYWRHH